MVRRGEAAREQGQDQPKVGAVRCALRWVDLPAAAKPIPKIAREDGQEPLLHHAVGEP